MGIFIQPAFGCFIALTAKDRFDPLFLTFVIKVHHAVHDTMVRQGTCSHPGVFYLLYKIWDLAHPIQKTVFSVDV